MFDIARRSLLAGAGIMALCSGAFAQESHTFRLANVLSSTDVTAAGVEKFAELVNEKSDGRITIEVFHGGQLGSGVETFEAVKNGNLDFAADSFANLASITPAFEVFHFPFLFESRAQLLNAMGSEKVQERVNGELEPVNLKWFSTFEIGGPREVGTSTKKIETAEDLAGMKFRASRSPLEIGSHEAWGAAGVTVDWPQTPESVRLGMVDGLTVPYASFYSAKFHEGGLIKYMLDLNFQNYASVLVVNAEKYAALPEDVTSVLEEAAQEAHEWHVDYVADYVTRNVAEMKEAGVEVYSLPPEEYEKVKEMTIDKVWGEFVGQPGMEQDKIDLIQSEAGEIGDGGWGYSIE
ncbi:TRAP transporter substrate-binding protein [Paracoccus saliphilus]|uniref:TRAP transporter substrate-binding protein n=1 Tax=Paracoccus saliphilus TaxID=405559 RepID=A0AA45W5N9_9RHOB|nr:TRAP transporter substrate-binding protein [Paracoccus saliphilus]WCR05586.1 TRAP transporter substrate-binding protein [Paracoccus saliphilus]SIS95923.1 TRAP-type C4-dicarboxylate transport system, substrate-binding protein [Paracoccus saliphilus]